jgi:hypothetical protein
MPASESLLWLAEELRPLVRPATPPAPSYTISVWCGEEPDTLSTGAGPCRWAPVATGVGLFGLRPILRHVLSRGWDTESTLVEREWDCG